VFVATLAEAWDCPDVLIGYITRELIRTDGREGAKVGKEHFLNFARTFGPWPKADGPNTMLPCLLRDFFDASKSPKASFHGYLEEKNAYRLLKAPGDYLYRYSANCPGAIAVSRTSTTLKGGKLQHTTDLLANTGSGTWQHFATKMIFSSLGEFEHKHKEKLLRLVCNAQDTAHVGNYGAFLMADEEGVGGKDPAYAPHF